MGVYRGSLLQEVTVGVYHGRLLWEVTIGFYHESMQGSMQGSTWVVGKKIRILC